MAGRNTHAIGLGSHALTAMGFPGYNAMMPATAKSVANYLAEQGYVNYALGKWDHTPLYEVSQVGPFDRWPSGDGFEHFYGHLHTEVGYFPPFASQKGKDFQRNGESIDDEGYETFLLGKEGARFVRERGDAYLSEVPAADHPWRRYGKKLNSQPLNLP